MSYKNPLIGGVVIIYDNGRDTGMRGQVIDSFPDGPPNHSGLYWLVLRIVAHKTMPDAIDRITTIQVGATCQFSARVKPEPLEPAP